MVGGLATILDVNSSHTMIATDVVRDKCDREGGEVCTLMILSWGFVEFEGCLGLGFSNLMKQHLILPWLIVFVYPTLDLLASQWMR